MSVSVLLLFSGLNLEFKKGENVIILGETGREVVVVKNRAKRTIPYYTQALGRLLFSGSCGNYGNLSVGVLSCAQEVTITMWCSFLRELIWPVVHWQTRSVPELIISIHQSVNVLAMQVTFPDTPKTEADAQGIKLLLSMLGNGFIYYWYRGQD